MPKNLIVVALSIAAIATSVLSVLVRLETLENSPDENAPVVVATERFPEARGLLVRGLNGELVVETWDGPGIQTVVTAPEGRVDTVLAGDILAIEDASSGNGSSGSGVHIHVHGNGVNYVYDSDGSAAASVLVRVPVGMTVGLEDVSGIVRIGNTDGIVRVNHSGIGDVSIGRVRSASVDISGTGSVTINEIDGLMSADLSGVGSVRVLGGEISVLNVRTSGVGDFSFDGTVHDATVDLIGVGDVSIGRVAGNRNIRKSGVGTVRIGE